MDGSLQLFLQIATTITTVGMGGWAVFIKLSNKIDKAKDAANAAKDSAIESYGEVKILNTKLEGFTNLCEAHRTSFDRRVARLEETQNSSRAEAHTKD